MDIKTPTPNAERLHGGQAAARQGQPESTVQSESTATLENTATLESIATFLPENYLPPYGARLGPEDFEPFCSEPFYPEPFSTAPRRSGWRVQAYGPDEQLTTYTVWGPSRALLQENPKLLGTRGGETVRRQDPLTYRNQSLGTPAAWYDWILQQDLDHRPVPFDAERPWEGNSVEAQLYRAEHHVVGYEDHCANTQNFATVGAFAAWLGEKAEHSTASFQVYGLQSPQQLTAEHPVQSLCMHVEDDDGAPAYRTKPLGEINELPETFEKCLCLAPDGLPAAYGFSLRMDGPQVHQFHGDWVQRAQDVLPHCTEDPQASPAWYVVVLSHLEVAILVPAQLGVLGLHFDHDGASLRFRVRCVYNVERENKPLQRHRRRWGKWLDEDAVLTEQELDAGVATAERTVEILREVEQEKAAEAQQKEDNQEDNSD